MKDYPEFFKRFSIIDFLSYLCPGALTLLYWRWILILAPNSPHKQDVFLAVTDSLFPENLWARSILFCFTAYLLGMITSEFSYVIWKLGKWVYHLLQNCAWLKKKLRMQPSPSNTESLTANGDMLAEYRRKAQLDHAFFELFRNLSVILPLSLGLNWACGRLSSLMWPWTPSNWLWALSLLMLEGLLIWRTIRFNRFYQIYQDDYAKAVKAVESANSHGQMDG